MISKGENDKKLAEILNEIDEKLVDIKIRKNGRIKSARNFFYNSHNRILKSLKLPLSPAALDEAKDYLTDIDKLLMQY